jgi:hypothetical protein
LKELKIEIERKREEINYKFDENDYRKRILQREYVLQTFFRVNILLNDNKILEIYNEISLLVPEYFKESFLERLYFEYFEELTIEAIDRQNMSYIDTEIYPLSKEL